MIPTGEEIILRLEDPPPCGRCSAMTLLQASFSHSWKNTRGEVVAGVRQAVLCPACDRTEPCADELLAWLKEGKQLDLNDHQVFGGLVASWVESVRHKAVDQALLAEQEERWHHGEL